MSDRNDAVPAPLPRIQWLTTRALAAAARLLHIEAFSGVVLLLTGGVALIWANSPWADSYHAFWHLPLSFGLGPYQVSESLHFWVNDALMTLFFLVVGMEIRRELHAGALADPRQSLLPLTAAIGGVMLPAMIYMSLNVAPDVHHGWAIPTATDIAFALGVLALLGPSIPSSVRIFLLTLAIIDDVIAVMIIALFYSESLDPQGLMLAMVGIAMVLGLQRMGFGSAYAYILPGAVLWMGLLQTGAHPTLAGVVLGLMTPVLPIRLEAAPLDIAKRAFGDIVHRLNGRDDAVQRLEQPLRQLRLAQRELVPPVTRVQSMLHPWVAYGVMPIFALANAGVTLDGIRLDIGGAWGVLLGVYFGLVVGKPLGVLLVSWMVIGCGWCRMPDDMRWGDVAMVGLLAGIGFTMAIFIAMLAFDDENLVAAAKLGVLLASATAAVLGLAWGMARRRVVGPPGFEPGTKGL